MYIIFLGAPGAGKGTQAAAVAQKLNLVHIASGDLFRQALEQGTELGLKAKSYMEKGVLVPDDMWRNENYWLTTAEIQAGLTEMFWEVGDYNRDAIVNVIDLTFVSFAFGCINGLDVCYDADADFNSDDIVDTRDVSNAAYHLLWQKEYP